MAIVLIMYMVDNLSNAMVNPMLMISAGGLSGWVMLTASTDPATTGAAISKPRRAKTPRPRIKRAAAVPE
jgi:hypothetical protein